MPKITRSVTNKYLDFTLYSEKLYISFFSGIEKPKIEINPKQVDGTIISKQRVILFASTLILVMLFFSAAVLLYRIGKIQHKYTLALQVSTIWCFFNKY